MGTIRVIFVFGLLAILMVSGCDFATRLDSEMELFKIGDERYFEYLKGCRNVHSYLQIGTPGGSTPPLIEIYPKGSKCVILWRGDAAMVSINEKEWEYVWYPYKCVFDPKDYRQYGTEDSIRRCVGVEKQDFRKKEGELCFVNMDCGEGLMCAEGTTYDYECRKIECEEDFQCDEAQFCYDGICKDIECETDGDCEEGFYCKSQLSGCKKIISTIETIDGYKYETMLEDGMTFLWCNYNLVEVCPNYGVEYGCSSDGDGLHFCRKICSDDSDCPENQFCIEQPYSDGLGTTWDGLCDWGAKDYSDYEE